MTTICSADNTFNFLLDFIFHSFCHIVATLQSIFISCKSWGRGAQLGYTVLMGSWTLRDVHKTCWFLRCTQEAILFFGQ